MADLGRHAPQPAGAMAVRDCYTGLSRPKAGLLPCNLLLVIFMKNILKIVVAGLLFSNFVIANASSPPPEVVISWLTALEKACSTADPVHAMQYKKGLRQIMDEDVTLSFKITHDEKFPTLVSSMETEVAKLEKAEFLRECTSLLVRNNR